MQNALLKAASQWLAIVFAGAALLAAGSVFGQGVTTAAMSGTVTDDHGTPLPGANVVAVHEPSGTQYGAASRTSGLFNIQNVRIGGPYTVTARFIGYKSQVVENVYLSLGQTVKLEFMLAEEAIAGAEVVVTAEQDEVLNASRTGAATFVNAAQVAEMPTIKRSTRDLTRLDPRSDGNFSFGGKNWLYNNISLDGSYFNNPFGLDDPAPGGQTSAEPVPYDAVDQVQVSVAPFDVREGGFTGAGINTVTKSGSNQIKGSIYTYGRNENLLGNKIRGNEVFANPNLSFNQSGFTFSGPLIKNKLFFFMNGELVRRDDPGTNYVANRGDGIQFGESRVEASVMDAIKARMKEAYNYDTGVYDNYIHQTDNDKFLLKLDWNVNANHNLTFRYNFLDARQQKPPHPFVLSFNQSGRGPNETSLPFQNAGYRMNNELNSFALELNSRGSSLTNRFFASYNRFRDFRQPFSEDFPTIEIGEAGVTYTTVGHEPFSIHNILDQDVWQVTNNLSMLRGSHVLTVGGNFEVFKFFNSFNIFRHGLFGLPFAATTFPSLDAFFAATDPNNPDQIDLRAMITPSTSPFKGEDINLGQLGLYAQDEFQVSSRFNLTYGLRVDFPIYFTTPVDNPYSRSLVALDENGAPEVVDQSKLPDVKPLWSPRVGFNYDVTGTRSTQLRGGTGIFTGRLPFVWIGNVISNPGANPNLPSHLQSFDLNAVVDDFKWPQVWTTNAAVDQSLPWNLLGTLELVYGRDINALYVRNADLVASQRTLPDGRPYYGGAGNNELNPDFGAGIYVLDNVNYSNDAQGNSTQNYNLNLTASLRKSFSNGIYTMLAYRFIDARNNFKSTEIASVLWAESPVMGNPNRPELSYSEFGNRHRVIGAANYRKEWSASLATSFGLFFEAADGNTFAGAGGNRYSFVYAGDVNGDGMGGNDMIYIPRNQSEIIFKEYTDASGRVVSPQEQWNQFNAFIEQDSYLSTHRGQIADRFGQLNPWWFNVDLRVLQDFAITSGAQKHTFQVSLDFLNLPNLIRSSWGVRKVATAAATTPLQVVEFDANGAPVFNYVRGSNFETFSDDVSLASRWQIQIGLRYFFN